MLWISKLTGNPAKTEIQAAQEAAMIVLFAIGLKS